MAHFAKLNLDKEILAVHVVSNKDTSDSQGNEIESIGAEFLEKIHGWDKNLWKKTSCNTKQGKYYNQDGTLGDQSKAFRGNFANIGGIYDENNDIFIDKKPYASWVLNLSTVSWEAPITYPVSNEFYVIKWDELNQRWLGRTSGEIETPSTQYFAWNSNNNSWESI
jgi:hypothetical protein